MIARWQVCTVLGPTVCVSYTEFNVYDLVSDNEVAYITDSTVA